MDHILDNAIWNALISGNKIFAVGEPDVKYFPEEIAPFVGLKLLDNDSLERLFEMLPVNRRLVLITAKALKIPASWTVLQQEKILQMVCEKPTHHEKIKDQIVPLEKKDIPEMIALTRLTNPGPFLERTIEFGNYKGIFKSNKLVAMAGQRLHAGDFLEISAVCTHPDHLGNGYAGALMLNLAVEYIARGKIPFLHVKKGNAGAIKLYEKIGFTMRKEMNLNVVKKEMKI
ncbi:MAG: GNAT family N-acetyltransferase [Ginsengibacter sp.]